MMRYPRLFWIQLRASLATAMQYRADFVVDGLMSLWWMIWTLVPLGVVFSGRGLVAGWSFSEALIVAAWFTILGGVLEGIPAIVLFGPLLFPIARAVGVHEVHYAMIIILAMGIGLFAPPFGVGYYAACAIGRVDPAQGMRPIWGYLLALLIGLAVVAIFPWISIGFL